jgi:hypothetical protein
MYRLWFDGRLGNHPRFWRTLSELLESDYRGDVWIRNGAQAASPVELYDVPVGNVRMELEKRGLLQLSTLVFGESPPNPKRTVQGELVHDWKGQLCFYFSTQPEPMRTALRKDGRQLGGIAALTVLRQFVDPASLEDLHVLLDQYPEHVIELSAFSCYVGAIPFRNTLIWEVRKY